MATVVGCAAPARRHRPAGSKERCCFYHRSVSRCISILLATTSRSAIVKLCSHARIAPPPPVFPAPPTLLHGFGFTAGISLHHRAASNGLSTLRSNNSPDARITHLPGDYQPGTASSPSTGNTAIAVLSSLYPSLFRYPLCILSPSLSPAKCRRPSTNAE